MPVIASMGIQKQGSRLQRALPALVAALLCSCGAFTPATVPMRSIVIRGGGSGQCLAVLLPGRFVGPESFEEGPFEEAVGARGIDAAGPCGRPR